jgi:hypothetical protein
MPCRARPPSWELLEEIAVHVPAVDLHLHNPHPRLDEPAREEAALADHVPLRSDRGRLSGSLERSKASRSTLPRSLTASAYIRS